jgi:hypothetical protein
MINVIIKIITRYSVSVIAKFVAGAVGGGVIYDIVSQIIK